MATVQKHKERSKRSSHDTGKLYFFSKCNMFSYRVENIKEQRRMMLKKGV